jgi:uncharacterized SAM-binding protein YcdF (DUF218 family)
MVKSIMFEYLKIIVQPLNWIIFFLVVGLWMTCKAARKSLWSAIGWFFCFLSLLIIVFMSTQPVERLLVSTLESKYSPVSQSDLARMDVIVVLGGGVDSKSSFQMMPEASGSTYSRMFNGVAAFKSSGAEKFILSGGQAPGELVSESGVMRDIAVKLGIPTSKIITEDRSGTTEEQAKELRKMEVIDRNAVMGLVTSAIHMMRSYRLFKKEFPEAEIIPIPAGYMYASHHMFLQNIIPREYIFHASSLAIHEWLGWLRSKF